MLVKVTFKVEASANLKQEEFDAVFSEYQNQKAYLKDYAEGFADPLFKITDSEVNMLVSEDNGSTWENL